MSYLDAAFIPSVEFIDVPYNGGNFTAIAGMTWTVEAADLTYFRYYLISRFMLIFLGISGSTIGGIAAPNLYIAIPGGRIPSHSTPVLGQMYEPNGPRYIFVRGVTGNNRLSLAKTDGANFVIQANSFDVAFQIMLEIL